MKSESRLNRQKIETQIVIVGGGGTGLAAAVAAAELGAKVVLLEKHNQLGGNTAAAIDIFACDSPVQHRLNIDAPTDKYFQIAMRQSHWLIDPRIVRAFIDKTGDTISWFEKMGINFELNQRKFALHGQVLPLTGHNPIGYDESGVIQVLFENAQKLGVEVLLATCGKSLIKNSDGKIIGIIAQKKNGDELEIQANCVIIASGGFGGNKEMMRKYSPYYNENVSLKGFPNMGEGITMALEAGAATEGLGNLLLESKGLPKGPKQIWLISWRPEAIWLNKNGERFTDETIDNVFEAANPVIRQPDHISYTVFDEEIKQKIIDVMNTTVMPHYYGRAREKEVARWLPPPEKIAPEDIGTLLKLSAENGDMKITNSWDEMASWIGAKPETLKASIEEYNDFCEKGRDAVFAKNPQYLFPLLKPPFYAIKCGTCILGTLGGLKVNHKMEVLDNKGNTIRGLYAGGTDTGGWETDTYNQLLTGAASSFAYNSGRIAGENAFKYVSSLK